MNQVRDFKGIWIPREIWLDEKLTIQEKIFFIEIDSLNNEKGCYANNHYFSNFFGISKTRVSIIIKSLIDKGYISSFIDQSKGNKRILKTLVNISLRPSLTNVIDPLKQSLKDNNTVNNTPNNTNNKREPSDKSLYDNYFNEFWNIYPRKVSKKKAETNFINYLKKQKDKQKAFNEIIEGLNAYILTISKDGTEQQFIKHPSTWINGECWNDELLKTKKAYNVEYKNMSLFPKSYQGGNVCVLCGGIERVENKPCPCSNSGYIELSHFEEWKEYYRDKRRISYNEFIKEN